MMRFRIVLPDAPFLTADCVVYVCVPTVAGSMGFLPHRRDCVVAIRPGVVWYRTDAGPVQYLAVDEGVLVKKGEVVQIATRQAVTDADLGRLHEQIEQRFRRLDQQEFDVRLAVEKLEVSLLRGMAEFHRG